MVVKQLPKAESRKTEDVRREGLVLQIIQKDKRLILSKNIFIEKFIDHLIRIDDNQGGTCIMAQIPQKVNIISVEYLLLRL